MSYNNSNNIAAPLLRAATIATLQQQRYSAIPASSQKQCRSNNAIAPSLRVTTSTTLQRHRCELL